MKATETEEPKMAMCVCKQKCTQALEWAARAPMAQCCADDKKCTCWCHEVAVWQAENKRSIWRCQ